MTTESWRRHWRPAILLSALLSAAPPALGLGDSTAVPPQAPIFVPAAPETATFLCHYNLRYQLSAQSYGMWYPAPACGSFIVVLAYKEGTNPITGEADGYCGKVNPYTGDCSCRSGERRVFLARGSTWSEVMWDLHSVTFECVTRAW